MGDVPAYDPAATYEAAVRVEEALAHLVGPRHLPVVPVLVPEHPKPLTWVDSTACVAFTPGRVTVVDGSRYEVWDRATGRLIEQEPNRG